MGPFTWLVCLMICSKVHCDNDKLSHDFGDDSNDLPNLKQPSPTFKFDDSTLYKINFLSIGNESNAVESKVSEVVDEEIIVTTSNQERYRCIIPNVGAKLKEESAADKDGKLNPYKLLKPLFSKKVCSYRVENYWTYELCHGKFIRQFHEESKDNIQQFYLGTFDMGDYEKYEKQDEQDHLQADHKRPLVTVDDYQLPYIEINMTGGTLCDLSNKKRMTRVLYVCVEGGKHEMYSIKETATCEYEVIAFSPMLCLSPDFRVCFNHKIVLLSIG